MRKGGEFHSELIFKRSGVEIIRAGTELREGESAIKNKIKNQLAAYAHIHIHTHLSYQKKRKKHNSEESTSLRAYLPQNKASPKNNIHSFYQSTYPPPPTAVWNSWKKIIPKPSRFSRRKVLRTIAPSPLILSQHFYKSRIGCRNSPPRKSFANKRMTYSM